MDTAKVATVVPASELSGRDAVVAANVIPVGVGGAGGLIILTTKAAVPENRSFIPTARTVTG
jgi:hypothetical protein